LLGLKNARLIASRRCAVPFGTGWLAIDRASSQAPSAREKRPVSLSNISTLHAPRRAKMSFPVLSACAAGSRGGAAPAGSNESGHPQRSAARRVAAKQRRSAAVKARWWVRSRACIEYLPRNSAGLVAASRSEHERKECREGTKGELTIIRGGRHPTAIPALDGRPWRVGVRPHTMTPMPRDTAEPAKTSFGLTREEGDLYRKVILRLIPFIFVCYVLNYIDRVNVSFAKLQFQSDLGLNDASYGLGVGLFYIGYILFEIPSNLLLQRIGARKTITRIMCLWGVISMAMAFVSTPAQFYIARILLGAAEAGFFPGIVLYLTYWFPHELRGRVMSFFVLAIAVSGIIGGPASGFIMQHLAGAGGFKGWQWLFLIEGLLPVIMGIAAYFFLNDRPRDARWLTASEKEALTAKLAAQVDRGMHPPLRAFLHALRMPKLWVATFGYFSITWAGMVLNFWAPTIIQRSGIGNVFHVGLLSAVPYAVGACGMLLLCRNSDRSLERRWHFAAAAFIAAGAVLAIAPAASDWVMAVACLALLAVGYLSAIALFWTIPTRFLSETESAGSIAFISSVGQIGSLLAPTIFGFVTARTGNLAAGSYLVAAVLACGGLAVLSLKLAPVPTVTAKTA
jgi:ACS family phthalate transporter-like MFS transporter